ncbi:hypothetical protein D9M71_506950 [compost metagenome]
MQDLTLQIGQVDRVEIRQVQFTDTRRRQVQRHGRTQATEADDQYPAVFEPQLPVDIDLSQEDLPAVAQ